MKFAIKRLRPFEGDQPAAALWYDGQQPGLGDGFPDESDAAINNLAENPLLDSIRFADVRCVRLRRFKRYGIYHLIPGEVIVVLAIHHGSRDPRWLRERRIGLA